MSSIESQGKIPGHELERMQDEAYLHAKKYNESSEFKKAFDSHYENAKVEWLRANSSQPQLGWVRATEQLPENDENRQILVIIGDKEENMILCKYMNDQFWTRRQSYGGAWANIQNKPLEDIRWRLIDAFPLQPIKKSVVEMEKKTGVDLIAAERREQIEKHGRTLEIDKRINPDGQLCWAAALLMRTDDEESPIELISAIKLPDWNQNILKRMDAKPYRERLIIAGALLAAELDRIGNIKTIEDYHAPTQIEQLKDFWDKGYIRGCEEAEAKYYGYDGHLNASNFNEYLLAKGIRLVRDIQQEAIPNQHSNEVEREHGVCDRCGSPINKYFDCKCTEAFPSPEQPEREIPEEIEKWIREWLFNNVVSGPDDLEMHNAKVVWSRAMAVAMYWHLQSVVEKQNISILRHISDKIMWNKVDDGLPDYEVPVLWETEEGNHFVSEIDKDDVDWWNGIYSNDGEICWRPKCTHWKKIVTVSEELNNENQKHF